MVWAIIKTQFEGYHCWEDAPKEVDFLRYPHRHLFYVELWIEQRHTERDIEYILEKRKLNKFIEKNLCPKWSYLTFSCEFIANVIKEKWIKIYPNRKIKVSVFEDNENGALVE